MPTLPGATCLICEIVEGREPSSRVYEDEFIFAFMDLYPVNPGHTLVVPKVHAAGLTELDLDLGARMWRVAHRIAQALRGTEVRCEGVNLFLADGEAAFQEVFHAHLHVFPRYDGDAFRIDADWRERARPELDAAAGSLRTALADVTE